MVQRIIKVKIKKLYDIKIDKPVDINDMSMVSKALCRHLKGIKTTAHNEFYDNIKVVCFRCGCTLHDAADKEDGCCTSCRLQC